ncbi:MAG: hypothetical protein EOP85_05610, partial [Verrucomicrobiaceae bacterium]
MTSASRISLASTVVILAVGGVSGFMLRGKVSDIRRERGELGSKAVSLGIRVDSLAAEDGMVTKRTRGGGGADVKSVSSALVAFAREMEEWQKNGSKPDDAFQKRSDEMMSLLIGLDPAQLKQVITLLRDDPSVTDDARRNMIGFSILMMGEDHPAAALGLYAECSELLNDGIMGAHVVNSTLARWAKEDPKAALAWLRAN